MPYGYQRPPDFTNEAGVQWWVDKSSTKYARSEQGSKPGLENVVVFLVKDNQGVLIRLIVEDNVPVYEHQSLEAIAVRLDVMKFDKSLAAKEAKNDSGAAGMATATEETVLGGAADGERRDSDNAQEIPASEQAAE